jgi:hypothetical protein
MRLSPAKHFYSKITLLLAQSDFTIILFSLVFYPLFDDKSKAVTL